MSDITQILNLIESGDRQRLTSCYHWYLQFSANGRWLSLIYGIGNDQKFVVWDLQSNQVRLELNAIGSQFACHHNNLVSSIRVQVN